METELNITKHVFVPKHSKLPEEEAKAFLESQNLSKTQIPKITKEDPALQGVEVKKGDIIKIIRVSPTTGESTFYRIVV